MFASKDTLLTRPSGYSIARSVRLRSSASAYLSRTFGTPTNASKWTKSFWIKRGVLGAVPILSAQTVNASANYALQFNSSDTFSWQFSNTLYLTTAQQFRDPSAWYHFVVVWDSANATAANRAIIYVNGVLVTSYNTDNRSSVSATQNAWETAGSATISYSNGTNSFDGYLTEINFIDGQALTPSSFGETDSITGVWKAKKYTGTYGTNGFYLNFSDNSSNTATTIGKDYSGNGNNWTPNNISVTSGVTYDSMTDVPTLTSATAANYAVLNPLTPAWNNASTLTNGNLQLSTSANTAGNASTIAISSGQFYWEIKFTTIPSASTCAGGIYDTSVPLGGANSWAITGHWILGDTGLFYANGAGGTASGTGSFAAGDIANFAFDANTGKFWVGKNGTFVGSPSAGTGQIATLTMTGKAYSGLTSVYNSGSVTNANFGQQPFVYTPPTGFVALNTYNLPASTITNGAAYMAATLYTGTGASLTVANTVGSASFQPDFVWVKGRSGATDHALYDSVRGTTKDLVSNSTAAETTQATGLTAFGSTGFTVGALAKMNTSSATYVGWQWLAGGTSASNTNGSITSTVSAGATQGFSVVTWTSQVSTPYTVGHGLGVVPSLIIVKFRSIVAGWNVYHQSLGATKYLTLQTTDAVTTSASRWNDTAPTSSVFTIGSSSSSTGTMVAYCFAAVAGYSAFGSYTGNGSTDGPFVFTNFRPRYVMVKRTDAAGASWNIFDTSRSTYNQATADLFADSSSAEVSYSGAPDILSNGFKVRGSSSNTDTNASGGTYIYMAFAENPFKNALAR